MGKIRSGLKTLAKNFDMDVFDSENGRAWKSFTTGYFAGFSIFSRRKLLAEYRGIVRDCVNKRSKSFSRYTVEVFRSNPSRGQVEPIEHSFEALLERPSPYMTKSQLLIEYSSSLLLTGDAFIFVAYGAEATYLAAQQGLEGPPGEPVQLWPLRPDQVDVVLNEDGVCKGYVVHTDKGDVIPLEPWEMIHGKDYNPFSLARGLGVVQATLIEIETENDTALFQRNFIKNQAAPAGVITLNGEVEENVFDLFKKQWRDLHSGIKNAGKTVILRDVDATFTKVGLGLGDLDMAALRNLTGQRLYNAFEVPRAIFGESDSSGLGRANIDAIIYAYEELTIEPDFLGFDDVVQLAIEMIYGEQVWIGHKNFVPENKEAKIAEQMQKVNTTWTVNEVRAQDGLDPVDGGDLLYVPFNMVALEAAQVQAEDIINPPEPDPVPPALAEANDSGDSEDPADDTTDPNEDAEKSVVVTLRKRLRKKTKKVKSAKVAKGGAESYFLENDVLKNHAMNLYKKELVPELDIQRDGVIAALKKTVEKSVDSVDKALDDVTDLEWILAVMAYEELADAVTPTLVAAYTQAGEGAVAYAGIASQEEFVVDQGIRNSILKSQERLMKSFNKDVAGRIQKAMAKGLQEARDAGLTKKDTTDLLTKRIQETYSGVKQSKANLIADTEAHRAVNEGMVEGYRQVGVVRIVWKANPDACPICQSLDGKEISIDEVWVREGEEIVGTDGSTQVANYGDISDDTSAHPRCRCQAQPVYEVNNTVRERVIYQETPETEELRKQLAEEREYQRAFEQAIGIDDGQSTET